MKNKTLFKTAILGLALLALSMPGFSQFLNLGTDVLYTLRPRTGIGTFRPEAKLHIKDDDSEWPALLIEGGSSVEGDITWKKGETFHFGTWDLAVQDFDAKFIITTTDKMSMYVRQYYESELGDKLSFFGDRLDDADMYGLGVESSHLYWKSNGGYRWYSQANADNGSSSTMNLKSDGKLGLGTDAPSMGITVVRENPGLMLRDKTFNNNGDRINIEMREHNNTAGAYIRYDVIGNDLNIGTHDMWGSKDQIHIDHATGSVGINTQSVDAEYVLMVNGKVRAKEIVVETGWADFVFEPDYELRSLEEVQAFIETNGHLPDVPSAAHIEKEGVTVGEMEAVLLRKVEELTLYLLEMKQENASLQTQLDVLKSNR